MNLNPIKISLTIIATLLVLLALTYFSKATLLEDGSTKEGYTFFNTIIKYPTTKRFFTSEELSKQKIKSIDSIVSNIEDIVVENFTNDLDSLTDAEIAARKNNFKATIPDFSKVDTSKIQRITYPKDRIKFITDLKNNLSSENSRVIHYGDSQLEGDRISAYVRNRLQQLYGGSGVGFIPVVQTYQQISVGITPSINWERYAYFDPSKEKFQHKKYGAYTSLARFTPYYKETDSINVDTLAITTATISIKPSPKSYRLLKDYTSVNLHYGNLRTPTTLEVFNDGVLIKKDTLRTNGKYHNLKLKFKQTPQDLSLVFKGKVSPDAYGLTLDSETGLHLDNVAMRGSSGTIFSGLDSESFTAMYKNLDPKVVIFQYGGNTVPYLKDSVAVTNYTSYLKNHINWVKRKTNNASVIFIGPSDMTTKENGVMKTYDLLPYLNESLENMCHDTNVAYWSMFKAMGGTNSMQHWVDQNLAGSDYTHFTASGTKIISELFFLALYMDLKK
jgi:lysophospholipase L1-like esterase